MLDQKSIRNQFETLMRSRGYNGRITVKRDGRGVKLLLKPHLDGWQVGQAAQVARQLVPGCIATAARNCVQITPAYTAYTWTGQTPVATPEPARPAPRRPREFREVASQAQLPVGRLLFYGGLLAVFLTLIVVAVVS